VHANEEEKGGSDVIRRKEGGRKDGETDDD
jgi:hypothetical protein